MNRSYFSGTRMDRDTGRENRRWDHVQDRYRRVGISYAEETSSVSVYANVLHPVGRVASELSAPDRWRDISVVSSSSTDHGFEPYRPWFQPGPCLPTVRASTACASSRPVHRAPGWATFRHSRPPPVYRTSGWATFRHPGPVHRPIRYRDRRDAGNNGTTTTTPVKRRHCKSGKGSRQRRRERRRQALRKTSGANVLLHPVPTEQIGSTTVRDDAAAMVEFD